MSLKYAVLGLLHERPMHGYEIKKIFEVSFARLWRVSPGQLYPMLRKIVEEGLAGKEVILQEGKPNAHIYKITSKGKRAFSDWLETPTVSMPLFRYDFMLKLFFYGKKNKKQADEEVKMLKQEHKNFIKQLGRMQKETQNQADEFQVLIIEAGILFARSGIKWLDSVQKTLQKEGR